MINPKKNDDFIKGLIKQGEGENLDFKLAINNPEKFAKTLAAFANTAGGCILIGINDQRKIIGIDVEEEMHMVDLANRSFLTPPIPLQYEVFEISSDFGEFPEEINLLLVRVERIDYPCYFASKDIAYVLYQRVKDRNVKISSASDPSSPPIGN